MIKESQLQKACLELLEHYRIAGYPVLATRTNAGKVKTQNYYVQLCRAGWPDITATIAGASVHIELKTLTGVHGDKQKEIRTLQIKAGGEYWLVRSLKDLKQLLKNKNIPT